MLSLSVCLEWQSGMDFHMRSSVFKTQQAAGGRGIAKMCECVVTKDIMDIVMLCFVIFES